MKGGMHKRKQHIWILRSNRQSIVKHVMAINTAGCKMGAWLIGFVFLVPNECR